MGVNESQVNEKPHPGITERAEEEEEEGKEEERESSIAGSTNPYKACRCTTSSQARRKVEDWINKLREEADEQQMKERTRYQESRERLSRRVMYILRHYLQKIPQKKVEEGGWIKIDTLKDFGIRVNPAAAIALGKGQGSGRKSDSKPNLRRKGAERGRR